MTCNKKDIFKYCTLKTLSVVFIMILVIYFYVDYKKLIAYIYWSDSNIPEENDKYIRNNHIMRSIVSNNIKI